jgi:hypothetical protein
VLYKTKAKAIYNIIKGYEEYQKVNRSKLRAACLLAVQGGTSRMLYHRCRLDREIGEHITRLARKQREVERERVERMDLPLYTDMEPLRWTVELVL